MQVAICAVCDSYENIVGMWMTLGGRVMCEGCSDKAESPVKKIEAIILGEKKENA